MSRDNAGNFTLPLGQVIEDTVIDPDWANTTLDDLADELTDSLSRSGKGGMLAELRLDDGSAALPGLAFGDETDLGFYRSGSGDFRAVDAATDIMKWSTAEVRVYQGFVGVKGLTVTNSTANSAGTTTTGNGTGAGIVAAGGASGSGGTFTGGGSSHGVVATGGATGTGGTFTGGATSGSGITATGGTGGGVGVVATGTNGFNGITATGNGNGYGIVATGGATSEGVRAIGGGASKYGVFATGGAGGGGAYLENGTAATSGTRQDALVLGNGDINMASVTYPSSTTAVSNRLTPANIPKAWATITTAGSNSTTATVNGGFNVASASVASTVVTMTLASAVGATGAATVTVGPNTGGTQYLLPRAAVSGATVTITAGDLTNAGTSNPFLEVSDFNFQTEAKSVTLFVTVFGVQ